MLAFFLLKIKSLTFVLSIYSKLKFMNNLQLFELDNEYKGDTFENENLSHTEFSYALLFGSKFINCDLRHTVFTDCDLRQVTFKNCDLRHTDFAKNDLSQTTFKDCKIYNTNIKSQPLHCKVINGFHIGKALCTVSVICDTIQVIEYLYRNKKKVLFCGSRTDLEIYLQGNYKNNALKDFFTKDEVWLNEFKEVWIDPFNSKSNE